MDVKPLLNFIRSLVGTPKGRETEKIMEKIEAEQRDKKFSFQFLINE
jgi:hypothetical protein